MLGGERARLGATLLYSVHLTRLAAPGLPGLPGLAPGSLAACPEMPIAPIKPLEASDVTSGGAGPRIVTAGLRGGELGSRLCHPHPRDPEATPTPAGMSDIPSQPNRVQR